jgi:CBS domain-containing protein
MNKVSALLSRKGQNAIHVLPSTSVLDALKLMAEKNIGSVVVMEHDNFMGIFTERDYSRKVILMGKHSDETKVSEVMSEDLPYVKPSDSVELCMSLMTQQNIRYLPVFENDRLCGIISMSDVVRETILQQRETISHLENYIRS